MSGRSEDSSCRVTVGRWGVWACRWDAMWLHVLVGWNNQCKSSELPGVLLWEFYQTAIAIV